MAPNYDGPPGLVNPSARRYLARMVDEPDPVILPIEDSLDLHAFSPSDVASVVDEYLQQAAAVGYGEVRLIHGRGIGVQRAAVQALLGRHPLVASFFDAPPERGGWGATIAILKTEP